MSLIFALMFTAPIFLYLLAKAYEEFSYEIQLSTGRYIHGRRTKRSREQMELEFPALVEVFAILIAGGVSPSAALQTIGEHSQGEFSKIIRPIIVEMKEGLNFAGALDALTKITGLAGVRRFADSLVVAVERGTPLADVVNRQVGEIRNSQRLRNLEKAGRAEIALMIPVVFLILPVSILFALWPSYYGLSGVIAM